MTRFDRYVLRIALTTTLLSLLVVCGLFPIIDFLFNIDRFNREGISSTDVLDYYLAILPQFVYYLGPFIILFGGMFAVIRLLRANEVLPIRVAGWRIWRALRMIVLLAIVSASGLLSLQEAVLPGLASDAMESGATGISKAEGSNVAVFDRRGNSWFIGEYDVLAKQPLVRNVSIGVIDASGTLTGHIMADELLYQHDRWYGDYLIRVRESEDTSSPLGSASRRAGVVEGVDLLPGAIPRSGETGVKSLTTLWHEMRTMPHIPEVRLSFWRSLTYPLTAIFLLMIGCTIAVRMHTRNILAALAISISLAFVVFSGGFVLEAMAYAKVMNPDLAALGFPALAIVAGVVGMRYYADH